ncbi:NAD(P)-dependent oxidoreductase [Halalkalibacter oceani]|uniref:NAD(P)-dependent oxidoreductase n=1 Tax=Halalkalibacter oceani TaxID=1653776 RepID=UPI003395E7B8
MIGIIGLGNMGSAIASKIHSELDVIGYDIDAAKCKKMNENGVATGSSLEEVAAKSQIIILSMPRFSISKSIVSTICPLLQKNAVIIETSTILPNEVRELREISLQHHIKLIDAAILGGVSHMQNKQADLLIGDSDDVLQTVSPVLKAMSKTIQFMGPAGAGMAAKIINNGVAHAVMTVIVESAATAMKLGISAENVYKLLSGETALLRPLTHRFHERIQEGNYEGGMSTENARKDSTLFLQLAQENGIPLFSIQAAHSVYEVAAQNGFGKEDYAAIAKLWEKWLNINFQKDREVSMNETV